MESMGNESCVNQDKIYTKYIVRGGLQISFCASHKSNQRKISMIKIIESIGFKKKSYSDKV
jgi:hypothetical protein